MHFRQSVDVSAHRRISASKCIRGIKGESVSIGRLERFVADYHMAHGAKAELNIEKNGKRVAVVGSGPILHVQVNLQRRVTM